jgi:outer membrane autotransporter protein
VLAFQTVFNGLPVVTGNVALNTIESVLGRVGVRFGTAFLLNDTLALQPFLTVSLWHEFKDNASSTFTTIDQNNVFTAVPVNTSRVGTFGQVGVGISGQILQTGWVGFVRSDVRFGENIQGIAGVLGVRHTFN